jgi:hypothetical protein
MTLGKVMRMQMMVAGLGIALSCAGATKAQEIVNTSFDDGPNVTAFAQPTAAGTAAANVIVGQPITADTQPSAAVEPANETDSEKLLWIGVSLVWLGAIGMYFSGPAKRFAGEMRAAQKAYKLAGPA